MVLQNIKLNKTELRMHCLLSSSSELKVERGILSYLSWRKVRISTVVYVYRATYIDLLPFNLCSKLWREILFPRVIDRKWNTSPTFYSPFFRFKMAVVASNARTGTLFTLSQIKFVSERWSDSVCHIAAWWHQANRLLPLSNNIELLVRLGGFI